MRFKNFLIENDKDSIKSGLNLDDPPVNPQKTSMTRDECLNNVRVLDVAIKEQSPIVDELKDKIDRLKEQNSEEVDDYVSQLRMEKAKLQDLKDRKFKWDKAVKKYKDNEKRNADF